MNPDKALSQLAKRVGIVPVYRDLAGERQLTARETKLALLRACGWELDNEAMITEAWKHSAAQQCQRLLPEEVVTVSGAPFQMDTPKSGTWIVVLEGTQTIFIEGRSDETITIPALPSGVHRLTFQYGSETEIVRLIAAPKAAPSVFDVTGRERLWGVNLSLYGLHSKRNPSLGDYEDLSQAAQAFATNGADFCGINPVHAIGWNSEGVISPYSPSHRGFLNADHIAVDQIAIVSDATAAMIAEWRKAAAHNLTGTVDYAQHAKHFHPVLRALYRDFKALGTTAQKTALNDFRDRGGERLQGFAEYESLSEHHGADWRLWPDDRQEPSKASRSDEQIFHIWLQWHAETQLEAAHQCACSAGMDLGLYLDLAVGARRDGAEAWVEQEIIAENVSIGAPPDHLSPAGQNWNLCAFAPSKLAIADYQAFRTILARNMRHCGILRIDHVLGLNRSFWIPDDGSPGGYIKQNFDTLLALVRIEAQRNQTVVIGEDLGLVPNGFRKSLAKSGLYSYSVLQYEKTRSGSFRKPARLQRNSLACFGTHDTPTLEGFSKKRDIYWREKLGWIDEKSASIARENRGHECEDLHSVGSKNIGKDEQTSLSRSVHKALASSPVAMVAVQFDDIEQQIEAQNLPGTIDEHPNWRRRASTSVDDFIQHSGLSDIARLMVEHDRNRSAVELEGKNYDK